MKTSTHDKIAHEAHVLGLVYLTEGRHFRCAWKEGSILFRDGDLTSVTKAVLFRIGDKKTTVEEALPIVERQFNAAVGNAFPRLSVKAHKVSMRDDSPVYLTSTLV